MSKIFFSHTAKWIWSSVDTVEKPHQYVWFRKEFACEDDSLASAKFLVSADTDFVAYLNGVEFGRGQFSDYSKDKTYSIFDMPDFKKGKNIITILVYYCGSEFQTYTPGQAGLIANIKSDKLDIVTDSSWLCCPHSSFQSGEMPVVTSQLGYTTCYDARNDIDYFSELTDLLLWKNAIEMSVAGDIFHRSLKPRPIPLLELKNPVQTKIIKQGVFEREKELDTFALTVSQDRVVWGECQNLCQLDYSAESGIKIESGNNAAVIVDLGRESVGFITLKLIAGAGTVVDISHGEHLDDGQVRSKIGARNFTDRYITKDGLNIYQIPFRRIGGRYLQLNITNMNSDLELIYTGIAPWSLPLPDESSFDCSDVQMLKLRRVAIDTMKLCMHEHYEDCPWREQALYSYDSRNQIIYGYYIWGNYKFAKASLELLGHGIRDDGYLNLCAPMKRDLTIPIFSFVWVSEVLEYYLYSGDIELFERFDSQIEFMIEKRLKNFCLDNSLYHPGTEEYLWSFYEWVEGLSEHGCDANEFNALYNMYFYEMLQAYRQLLIYNGEAGRAGKYRQLGKKLKDAIVKNFWNTDRGCFATRNIDGKQEMYHEHTQFLALSLDIADDKQKEMIADNLYSANLVESSFSPMLYMVKAALKLGGRGREFIQMRQARAFAPMLAVGATSLWETPLGAQDFELAGSLCHAWSSLPVYYCHAFVLGVTPLEPGFKSFKVSPWKDQFEYVSGMVPTPYGMIEVSWKLKRGKIDLKIEHPEGLTPVVEASTGTALGKVEILSGQ